MNTAPDTSHTFPHDLILLLSRLLLAWIFVHEGVLLIANFSTASAGMAKLGVPPPLVIATIALQLVAGLAIATGVLLRPAAAALGLFCVATAVLFHTNFANRNELLHFEKDLAIAGGMFALALCGAGRWSIALVWRTRSAHVIVTPQAARESATQE
ncbi:DoxX family protein [Bradyrhizobium prioriisuperbiae]|uniref:DoxX family protein n=1 Tax=Bradyrhizobium prioriisuperbiae TaxID=2854389 RepID=UPI0028E738D8|nr:DoxX family protein [Bradyrhizobium prioritasuperba]